MERPRQIQVCISVIHVYNNYTQYACVYATLFSSFYISFSRSFSSVVRRTIMQYMCSFLTTKRGA